MGYSDGSLTFLDRLVSDIPTNGRILELGAQDINADVAPERLLASLTQFHGDEQKAEIALKELLSGPPPWRAWELFRGTGYTYRCLDLFPGEFIIQADLNLWRVPEGEKGTFDLVTNIGTTEHVADQINVFRVIHDYTAVGGMMVHSVPFTGYYNHGLFNYHPLFFIFLAQANGYEVEGLGLSGPHLPYNIPTLNGVWGANEWANTKIDSGIINCTLRKKKAEAFQLFTDFDQETMGRMELESPWAEMVRDRYDLRVRDQSVEQAVHEENPPVPQTSKFKAWLSAVFRSAPNNEH